MRVHVTGGSGFLGGHVLALLDRRGHEVTALARSTRAARQLEDLGAVAIAGDLGDPASVDAAFSASEADVLINLASLGFGHAGTIVAAAEEAGLDRAVFVSTAAVFTKLNAASKAVRLAAEEAVRSSNLRWTIVRPTMIYGTSGDRNMWRLLRLLRRTPLVPMPGDGRSLQQPVHVVDLASAIVSAAERDEATGRSYNLAGPEALTFRRVIDQAGAAVGRSPVLVPLPASALSKILGLAEQAGAHLPLKAEQIERLTEDKSYDISNAGNDLGFAPRTFASGIAEEARPLIR